MGVNGKADQDAGSVSKYHDEKMGSSSGGAQNSPNPQIVKDGMAPHGLNYPSDQNPMMPMSGGKAVPGEETNMGNPMMPMSGGGGGSEVPSQGQVMETNPQGHKSAPLAGKLRKFR